VTWPAICPTSSSNPARRALASGTLAGQRTGQGPSWFGYRGAIASVMHSRLCAIKKVRDQVAEDLIGCGSSTSSSS